MDSRAEGKNLTIEQMEKMTEPTKDFLVRLEDNTPGVRFNGFKLRDCDSGVVFHEYYPENIYGKLFFLIFLFSFYFRIGLLRKP